MDREFGKTDIGALDRLNFYFFRKRHSVAFKRHLRQDASSEDPHTALRIADPAKIKYAHCDREDEVANLMFEAHRLRIANGKAGCVEEIDIEMTKCFEQIRNGVGRIAMVAIERDNDVSGGVSEAALVGSTVATGVLSNDVGAQGGGHFAGSIGRTVIYDNDFVDERRHPLQNLLNPLLLVQAGHDDGNALVVIHQKRKFQNAMRTLALLVSTTLSLSIFLVSSLGLAQQNAELSQVQTIYLMPMANGFDQYLANSMRHVPQLRVVTDATKADAVFCDRIGASFEAKLDEMDAAAKEKAATGAPASPPDDAKVDSKQGFKFAPKMVTSIGRGKGSYFIVDRRSRLVLWSSFHVTKDVMPKTLHAAADKIAAELEKDFISPKKPKQ